MGDKKYCLKCMMCQRVFTGEKDFLEGTSRWRMCGAKNLWFDCSCGATLILKRGQFPWYAPDMSLSDEAKSVFNTMTSLQKLPYISQRIMQLQGLIKLENTTSKQLAEASKKEPIIASNVLRIANRLIQFREGGVIQSLEHAISYMGFRAFGDMIVTASVQSFQLTCRLFSAEKFWQEAFLRGRIAEYLAQKFAPELVADEVYLAGTLCNIGKLATAICLPEMADKFAMDEANPKIMLQWISGERRYGVASHQILGEIAASLWGFPDFVILAARYHHQSRYSSNPKFEKLLEIVTFANQLSHWLSLKPANMDMELLQAIAAKFSLTSDEKIDSFVTSLMPLTKVA